MEIEQDMNIDSTKKNTRIKMQRKAQTKLRNVGTLVFDFIMEYGTTCEDMTQSTIAVFSFNFCSSGDLIIINILYICLLCSVSLNCIKVIDTKSYHGETQVLQ
jgi:hypothetical protein